MKGTGVGSKSHNRGRRALWVAAPLLALTAGCSSSPATVDTGAAPASSAPASPSPSPSPSSASPSPPPSPSIDPGTLPQTHVLPSPNDPVFKAGVQDLWQAIVTDNPTTALPFFFPESAYLQVKAISDPAADYQSRLITWYRLDIEAAHALLG